MKEKNVNNGNKTAKRSVKTVAVMMGATVIAKVLGLLRSMIQSSHYGTSDAANALTAASKLPVTFFDLLLAAAVLGCFIPVYNSHSKDGELAEREADEFAGVFLAFITLACTVLAAVGMVFAEPLVSLIAPGLDEGSRALAVMLARIMFPLVIFTGSAYTLVGVLQSKGSFIAPAMISAISNAGVVLYLLLLDRPLGERGIYGLAAAYMLSWLVQLLTLVVPLVRLGFKPKFALDLRNPSLRRALKMAPPIMLGSWLSPAGILLGQYFASSASRYTGISGAATVFDIANNIYIILAGTLTYSICNYTFPQISRLSASGNREEFAATVRSGLTSALAIILPFMAAALVLAPEGVSILYLRGEFTARDASNTTATLLPILCAMPFFCVTELFTRVFYSQGRVKIPMLSALAGIAANALCGAILVGGELVGLEGVGIANAAGQLTSALVLVSFAARSIPGLFGRELARELLRLTLGAALVWLTCAGLRELSEMTPLGGAAYESGLLANTARAVAVFVPACGVYGVYWRVTRRPRA